MTAVTSLPVVMVQSCHSSSHFMDLSAPTHRNNSMKNSQRKHDHIVSPKSRSRSRASPGTVKKEKSTCGKRKRSLLKTINGILHGWTLTSKRSVLPPKVTIDVLEEWKRVNPKARRCFNKRFLYFKNHFKSKRQVKSHESIRDSSSHTRSPPKH